MASQKGIPRMSVCRPCRSLHLFRVFTRVGDFSETPVRPEGVLLFPPPFTTTQMDA